MGNPRRRGAVAKPAAASRLNSTAGAATARAPVTGSVQHLQSKHGNQAIVRAHEKLEADKAAAVDYMLMIDGIEARVNEAIGSEPLFTPASRNHVWMLAEVRLSPGAARFLGKLMRDGLSVDIDFDAIHFRFMPSLPGTVAETTKAVGSDFWVIEIDESKWNRMPTSAHKLALLAHELTHVAQEAVLPWWRTTIGTNLRYFEEHKRDDNYTMPETLKDTQFHGLNPLDPRYTMEQIANRSEYAVLVEIFRAEPRTWNW